MKRFRNCCTALLIGCSAPLLIWVGAGAALYQQRKAAKSRAASECAVNSDCPPGFVCVGGHCVPEN
jgi:hypothetical protein